MTDTATAALTGDNGGAEPQGAAPTGSPAPETQWNAGFDEDTNAFIQNKGWKSPADILNSYRNLEKFAGGSKNLLEMPGADADEEALNNFYTKLGRPESPDKYGIQPPEGADGELVDWFKNTAHKVGLTDKQAASLFEDWNNMSTKKMQAIEAAQREQSEKDIGELKKEWGQAYNQQIDAGKKAVAALGYDENSLNALESKMGTADMLRLFATLGSKMGEDSFVGGERSGQSFGVTPAAARQQIADLKMDKNFMDQYLTGNPDAVSKMKRLMEAAHG